MTAETPSNASPPVSYVVPSEILTVIGRYYAHRRQSRMDNAINAAAPLRWDKDADLAALNEVCERLRTPYEASCGTFQFTAPDGSMHRIDEDSYPHSKPVNASIMGQVLAARLRRQGKPSYISACIPNPYELMSHLLELDWLELTPAQLEYLKNSFAPAPPTAQTVDPFTLSKQRFNAAIEWMKQNPTRGTQNVTFEIQDDPTPKETPAEKEERENEECRLATVAACQNQEALITRPATAESITQAPVSITPQKDTRGKMNERIARLIDNADRITTFLEDVRYPLGSVRQIADTSFSEQIRDGFDDLQKRADSLLAAINEGLPQPTEISVRIQQKETEILNFLRSLIRPDTGLSLQTLNQVPDVRAVFEEISQTAYKIVSFIERD